MKRRLIAILASGFVALPALANNEIDAGNAVPIVTPILTQEQVRGALLAAQRSGEVVINAELGTLAKQPAKAAGKTREQVYEEILKEQQAGRWRLLGVRG